MTKFIVAVGIGLLAMTFDGLAQGYKSRQPYASEREKVAGLDWYIKDGPMYQILQKYVGEGENFTMNPTNQLCLFRSDGALTNCVAVLPNPTNNLGRVYEFTAFGNVTIKLTNNPVGSFTSITNVTASTYTIPTNASARVYSTGTNWLVVPGTK